MKQTQQAEKPRAHNEELNFLMAHAGISPDWDLETTKSCAAEVELILQLRRFSLSH